MLPNFASTIESMRRGIILFVTPSDASFKDEEPQNSNVAAP